MPVLEINEDEKKLLLIALVHDRVRIMHEWAKIGDDDGRIDPDGDRWVIDGVVDAMTDLRRKIEAADGADNTWPIDPILGPLSSRFDPKVSDQIDIAVNGSPKLKYVIRKSISTSLLEDIRQAAYASIDRLDADHDEQVTEPKPAWHHKHGWLHPKKAMEAATDAVEAGDLTREDVAADLGFDLAEVDAQIASIRDRLDRLEPGTWTTLPDEVDAEGWMFDITDPNDKIVIASGDTQTDGTVVCFHTFPTEANNAVSKGILALITRNFSLASDRDMKLAEKTLKADPKILDAIKSGVEDLQKALAQDGNVKIEADPETAPRLLRDLDLAQRSF